MKKVVVVSLVLTAIFTIACKSKNRVKYKWDSKNYSVHIVGAMKHVMRQGKLEGNIYLDSISRKEHLFGIGPEEFLTSELLIIDGKAYQSKVVNDSVMTVVENFNVKAPFFVYSNVSEWKEVKPKKAILNDIDLEEFLIQTTKDINVPFTFKVVAELDSAWIHIVNLPKGTKVSSPEEAHQGLVRYKLTSENVNLVGFFSKKHKRIFTHHTTFMHIHLINDEKSKMGHLENIYFKKGRYKIFIQSI